MEVHSLNGPTTARPTPHGAAPSGERPQPDLEEPIAPSRPDDGANVARAIARGAGSAISALSIDAPTTVASIFILVVLLGGVLAPILTPYDPMAQDATRQFAGVSLAHPLGTDELGRDMLARILYGSRSMLLVTLLSVLVALVIGTSLGIVAGFRRGSAETVILRTMDVMLSFPLVLLAITIVVALGTGVINLTLAIGISQIPLFTLLARSLTLTVRDREFVQAARGLGAGDARILWSHVLPNIVGPLVVQATGTMAVAMLQASALNFLGFGLQPPQPDWGAMIADFKQYVFDHPDLPLTPGLAITFTAIALSLIGDGLALALDPAARKAAGPR